jgi:catechol 2,3-dioxygenase-like lactoylglutathione lyase family enzyme
MLCDGVIMIKSINHITLAVRNVEKSFGFYKDILGLKPIAKIDDKPALPGSMSRNTYH